MAYVKTSNDGRTVPFIVGERRDFAEAAFLPRPQRNLESSQYTGCQAGHAVPLTVEAHSKRYRGTHTLTGDELYYKDYEILHLGASYRLFNNVTFNARVNNLLDKDFTTYRTEFRDLNGDSNYLDTNEVVFFDDYNNKDAARSLGQRQRHLLTVSGASLGWLLRCTERSSHTPGSPYIRLTAAIR